MTDRERRNVLAWSRQSQLFWLAIAFANVFPGAVVLSRGIWPMAMLAGAGLAGGLLMVAVIGKARRMVRDGETAPPSPTPPRAEWGSGSLLR